jgi:transcriptional regulator with XRE-family HTH domain
MNRQITGSYLRAHRKRAGLSQRELGRLMGYDDAGQVSRHERSKTAPPLIAAMAYEAIFGVPISLLFAGFHTNVTALIEANAAEFENDLKTRVGTGPATKIVAQKLEWLKTRKASMRTGN